MKRYLFLILHIILLNFVLCFSSLKAQVYSEAPVSISEEGEILTDMIYINFKPNDILKIRSGDVYIDGSSISDNYSEIKKLFTDHCKEWGLRLNEIRFSKAIPQASEEDTLYVDEITGDIKTLPNFANLYILRFPKPVEVEKIMARLRTFTEVDYTHGPVQWVDCGQTPNDPKYVDGSQWYLNTIQAPNAWGISKGNSDINIALIESGGVELTHVDLQSKIVGGDGNPGGVQTPHGTSVAGIAGAVTNNETGIASLGWNISLLTYKPYNDDNVRTVLAQKIKDAADGGASVINLSFRTIKTGLDQEDCSGPLMQGESIPTYYANWNYFLVRDAINYALGKNVVVVAAAGNNAPVIGGDRPCTDVPYPIYPAQYSGVIAVSGSQQDNSFVDGWNYGSFEI